MQTKSNSKKILLTRELHEVVIVRSRGKRFSIPCDMCQTESDFISLDEAVKFSGVGTREILKLVDKGLIHSFETPDGIIYVCASSVLVVKNQSDSSRKLY